MKTTKRAQIQYTNELFGQQGYLIQSLVPPDREWELVAFYPLQPGGLVSESLLQELHQLSQLGYRIEFAVGFCER